MFILLAVGVALGSLMLVFEVLYNVHKRRQQLAHRVVVSEWRRRARDKRELNLSLARLHEISTGVAARTVAGTGQQLLLDEDTTKCA